jgi:hypothetical protein
MQKAERGFLSSSIHSLHCAFCFLETFVLQVIMAESLSSARGTRSGGLQQIRVGPRVGTLYVVLSHFGNIDTSS